MKKLFICLFVMFCLAFSGCSNKVESYEEKLPSIMLELIDAGFTIKEASTDERLVELSAHWTEKSGIKDFKFVAKYQCTIEIEGSTYNGLIEVFGSAEQAEYYKTETDSVYTQKAETLTYENIYFFWEKGLTQFSDIVLPSEINNN